MLTLNPRQVGSQFVLSGLLIWLLCLSGCTATHLYQIDPEGSTEPGLQNAPSTEWETKTITTYFWGLIRQDLPISNCREVAGPHGGIEEVKVTTNVGQGLLTVITFGLVRPTDYSWRCAKPCPPSGTLN